MKTKLIMIVGLLMAMAATAQDFKVAKATGRLEIYIGNVQIEGYAGNEILFSSEDEKDEDDDRAKGLRSVNSLGLDDNTGLGINVTTKGETIEVRQLKKMNSPEIRIKVPKGVTIYYEHQSQHGGEVKFKNVEGEIEVSTQYNSLEFENITGPITAKAVYGSIEATFSANIKGPISLVSVYGHVDVAIPAGTKANLKLNTSYGEIFVAPEFKIEMDKQGDMIQYGDRISGKINGGGMAIDLSANYSKIYLRKK
jgi:DUF4097 and DUF4098 domain-containing protein YvlB